MPPLAATIKGQWFTAETQRVVFVSLEKALAIYGAGKSGKNPVRDKAILGEELRKAVDAAAAFCAKHKVMLAEIEAQPIGT